MKRLRTLSTRRLIALAVTVVVLVAGVGIAQGALQSHPTPPPKPLDVAVHDALSAPAVAGISARVTFTNHLIASGALPDGAASPLLTGASGRLWVRADGRFRVELQSDAGDAQLVSDGKTVTLYDAATSTVYRFALPRHATTRTTERHSVPTLAQIDRVIAEVGGHWALSGARPTSTAGQPTYTVRIAPKDPGGLFGGAALAWDAANGIPLRAAVYARGQSAPVLELRATDVSFGPVSLGDVSVTPPAGAKVVDLTGSPHSLAGHRGADRTQHHGTTVTHVGKGLGAIVVIERKAKPGEQPLGAGGGRHSRSLRLPTVDVNGVSAQELPTALGTILFFQRGGIDYVVAGSAPAAAVEAAARQLR